MIGYILKDNVLLFTARYRHNVPLREPRQEIITTVERLRLIPLPEQLLQSRKQITIVIVIVDRARRLHRAKTLMLHYPKAVKAGSFWPAKDRRANSESPSGVQAPRYHRRRT